MKPILCICGKQVTGKNTILNELVNKYNFTKIENKIDGKDYSFISDERFYEINNKMNSMKLVTISDIRGLKSLISYFGNENIVRVYLMTDNILREKRCKDRGNFNQEEFNRTLADENRKFDPNELSQLFSSPILNYDLDLCVESVVSYYNEKSRQF